MPTRVRTQSASLGIHRCCAATRVGTTRLRPITLGHNPSSVFRGEAETIIGLYGDQPIVLDDPGAGRALFILNGTSRERIDIVHGTLRGGKRVKVVSRAGNALGEATVEFPVSRLDVEVGGYAMIAG